MSQDEFYQSGLYKLTEQEIEFLDNWLLYESASYRSSVPRVKNWKELDYFYKTDKFIKNSSETKRLDEAKIKWKWKIALTAVFQNEAPYLKEFIEFYKLMGVEHFFLYNNLSNDHYYSVLEEYINKGEVELFEWPVVNFVFGQCSCYADSLERSRGQAKWLVVADTDLFFYPVKKWSLGEFLAEYDAPYVGGVVANYYNFGTNQINEISNENLMIDLLDHRHAKLSDHVRSIVKPHKVLKIDNPHFARYLPGYYAVDENFQKVEYWLNTRFPNKKFVINHYMFRTKNYLYNIYGLRHARFTAEHQNKKKPTQIDLSQKEKLDDLDKIYSEIKDDRIKRFVPLLRKQMFMK